MLCFQKRVITIKQVCIQEQELQVLKICRKQLLEVEKLRCNLIQVKSNEGGFRCVLIFWHVLSRQKTNKQKKQTVSLANITSGRSAAPLLLLTSLHKLLHQSSKMPSCVIRQSDLYSLSHSGSCKPITRLLSLCLFGWMLRQILGFLQSA